MPSTDRPVISLEDFARLYRDDRTFLFAPDGEVLTSQDFDCWHLNEILECINSGQLEVLLESPL